MQHTLNQTEANGLSDGLSDELSDRLSDHLSDSWAVRAGHAAGRAVLQFCSWLEDLSGKLDEAAAQLEQRQLERYELKLKQNNSTYYVAQRERMKRD